MIYCAILNTPVANPSPSDIVVEVWQLARDLEGKSEWCFSEIIEVETWLNTNYPLMNLDKKNNVLVAPSDKIDAPFYYETGFNRNFSLNEYEKALALSEQSRRLVEDFIWVR